MTLRFTNPIHTFQGKKFREIFGISVMRFWNIAFGFDIVKFDDWLKTPENISTKDHIEKLYGKPAVKVVKSLIGLRPFVEEK